MGSNQFCQTGVLKLESEGLNCGYAVAVDMPAKVVLIVLLGVGFGPVFYLAGSVGFRTFFLVYTSEIDHENLEREKPRKNQVDGTKLQLHNY